MKCVSIKETRNEGYSNFNEVEHSTIKCETCYKKKERYYKNSKIYYLEVVQYFVSMNVWLTKLVNQEIKLPDLD